MRKTTLLPLRPAIRSLCTHPPPPPPAFSPPGAVFEKSWLRAGQPCLWGRGQTPPPAPRFPAAERDSGSERVLAFTGCVESLAAAEKGPRARGPQRAAPLPSMAPGPADAPRGAGLGTPDGCGASGWMRPRRQPYPAQQLGEPISPLRSPRPCAPAEHGCCFGGAGGEAGRGPQTPQGPRAGCG